jgi:hypothetical protein
MCECEKIVEEINEKYPDVDWDENGACDEWHKKKQKLKNNTIAFEKFGNEELACTCPTCGKIICGWCA